MEQRKGIAASPGIAISQALILDSQQFPISHRKVPAKEVPGEKKRFLQAVADAISELQSIQKTAALQAAGEHLVESSRDPTGPQFAWPRRRCGPAFTHRIVDGVAAARFMADLREALENPEVLL